MSLVGTTEVAQVRRAAPRSIAVLASLAVVACGGSDGTGPGNGNGNGGATVSTVQLAGATNSIEVGETLQLTATALDSEGNVLSGKTFTWTSTNTAVASVNASGMVVGQTAGQATINATADGKSGAYAVTVAPPTIPNIASVSPATLVPGQPATLTGTNFSVTAANNVLTVGGANATVTAATATSITFTVPPALCVPGAAAIVVSVNGRASNTVNQAAEIRGQAVNLAVGEQLIVAQGTDPCLQFAANGGSEAYVLGVQYINETVSNLQTVAVGHVAAGAAGAVLLEPFSAASTPLFATADAARAERWRRHRRSEIAFRYKERATVEPFLPALAASRARSPFSDAVASIPGNLTIGSTVSIRVPDRNGASLCNNYTEVTTTVKAISNRSVWLEDNANPAGGFTTAEYNSLASQFDNTIWATDTNYFGMPSDIDGDGKVAIVVTKEVNRAAVLGFTSTTDQIPRASCASSNGGEVYYGIATDAAGAFGDAYEKSEALLDAPLLIAHEFSHIIQFSVRLALGATTNAQLPAVWELEGQATLAEEVTGHASTNRSPGNNLSFNIAFNCNTTQDGCATGPDPIAWYLGSFIDLVLYYGFETATTKVQGAPEQCSWLDVPTNGNNGPCLLEGREVYGVPWSILRFISDQYGSQFTGGEAEIHRQLLNGTTRGFANIQRVLNVPMRTILARWAASLYGDDRIPGLNSTLQFKSWDLESIRNALVESAQLVPKARSFSGFNESVAIRAGSTAYYRLSGTNRPAGSFRVRATNGGLPPSDIQLWVMRAQ